jgi:hypothetical protein
MIEVYDDILPTSLLSQAEKNLEGLIWREFKDIGYYPATLISMLDRTEPLWKMISDMIAFKLNISNSEVIWMKVNLTYASPFAPKHSTIHNDFYNKYGKEKGHLIRSTILYLTESDGDTYFYTDREGTLKQSIAHKRNRLTCFDGNDWHAAGYPVEHEKRYVINTIFLLKE